MDKSIRLFCEFREFTKVGKSRKATFSGLYINFA